MNSEDSYNIDFIEMAAEFKFLSNSKSRLMVLSCLFDEELTIKEIKEKTNLTYSSISGIVSQLKKRGYVKKRGSRYILNSLAKMKLYYIFSSNRTLNFTFMLSDFFNYHNVEPLYKSFKDLSALHTFELVQSSVRDIHCVVNTFEECSLNSKSIKAILPFIHPHIESIFYNWIENDVRVELIVNEDVYQAMSDIIDNLEIKKKIQNRYFDIKVVVKPIDIAVLISDNVVAMNLFKDDGSFDFNSILISRSKEARIWANLLFDEYHDYYGDVVSLKNLLYKKGAKND